MPRHGPRRYRSRAPPPGIDPGSHRKNCARSSTQPGANAPVYQYSQKRGGLTKEEWSLQQTPMGSLILVQFEAADIEKAFATLGQSSDDFDVWFRGRVLELTGVDLAAEPDGPPPEIILDWRA